ncbi:hypothetical protein MF406_00825 [Georgenia sp. TF02-10]|uniref:hypothetical protein n=1 Tax=Georgenia sp. TF02-10 TaxID=2917725 RepID=UPI001FA6E60D|nr:hypothetical protein [Georgenia sp. TF02-10]UNX54877.1 hypothetical protein MF406_00825 [Georgenia sp. TF02-10]
MWTDEASVVADVSHADWVVRRVTGRMGTVSGTVPDGYPAYARILHPVELGDGSVVPWSRVAEVTGRRVHPTVQWHRLIGAEDPWATTSDLWADGSPEEGNLPVAPLLALCDLLATRTTTAEDCFFAIWDGWGSHNGGSWRITFHDDGTTTQEYPPPLFSREERAAPRLHLPHRDYHLLRGPLSAMAGVAQYDGPEAPWTQSPSLFWPADRA